MDGTNIIVIHNNVYSYGLAVEWNSLQLYWTNAMTRSISVTDLQGNNRRVFNCSNTHYPSGIVLDPHEGVMFWTDWGSRKVMKSTLEGTQCVALVASKLSLPEGITLDRRNKLVFWADSGNGAIESVDYSGNYRRVVCRPRRNLLLWGVAFISPYLFFTLSRGNCYKVDPSNGSVLRSFGINPRGNFGLVAFDSSLQSSAVTCPLPTNAVLVGCKTSAAGILYDIYTECSLSCKQGIEVTGSIVRRCNKDGKWSGAEHFCAGMTTANTRYLESVE
ncbi:low-density lipoprotein receptor-related protein 4-like [Stylophora pistillata]|uniref:low-density lipoprotein receptor-related protein 4-like n=1 Tax=Stylophora pistillata TaxID=50429 RepID=UPI000C055F65|nr:low-density lipoprotein receptor-related protein 4-like [Stylophora pistillata]